MGDLHAENKKAAAPNREVSGGIRSGPMERWLGGSGSGSVATSIAPPTGGAPIGGADSASPVPNPSTFQVQIQAKAGSDPSKAALNFAS